MKKYISLVLGLIAAFLLGMGLVRIITSAQEWDSITLLLVGLLSLGIAICFIASVLSLHNPRLAAVLFIVSISFIALQTLLTLYLLMSRDVIITRSLSSLFLILAAAYNCNPQIFRRSREKRW